MASTVVFCAAFALPRILKETSEHVSFEFDNLWGLDTHLLGVNSRFSVSGAIADYVDVLLPFVESTCSVLH